MPPKRALFSQLWGRFQGLSSKSDVGGMGFGFLGVLDSQEESTAELTIMKIRE